MPSSSSPRKLFSPLPWLLLLVVAGGVLAVGQRGRSGPGPADAKQNPAQGTESQQNQQLTDEWQTSFVEQTGAMSDGVDYFAWQVGKNQLNPVFDWKGGIPEQSSPGSTAVRRHIQWGEAPNMLAVEFETDAPEWELRCAPTGNGWRVLVHDVGNAAWQVAGSWKPQAGGIPMLQRFQHKDKQRKPRRWRIEYTDQLAIGVRLKKRDTMAANPANPPLKRVVWCGDSFVEGTGAPSIWQGFAGQAGALLNVDSHFDAAGATGYLASGPPALQRKPYGERLENVTQANPSVVVIYGSINDGRFPASEVAEAARKYWAALHQALPKAQIIAIGPAPQSEKANTAPLNQALQAVAAESNVTFVDASSWKPAQDAETGAKFVSPDGVHPTLAGHTFLAQKTADALRPLLEKTAP